MSQPLKVLKPSTQSTKIKDAYFQSDVFWPGILGHENHLTPEKRLKDGLTMTYDGTTLTITAENGRTLLVPGTNIKSMQVDTE